MSVTLSGTFLNPDGSNIGVGTLILTLSQSAVETGTGWVVPSVVRVSLTNGAIPGATTVLGNDALTPAGTVYSASILTSTGFSWNLGSFSITGSSFNFNDAVPVSQNLIFPPTTLAIKPAAADGIQFVSANGLDTNDGLSWGSAKATINAAVTAAGANGMVYISPDVSASMSTTNSSNIPIVDFRQNSTGAVGFWHGITSMRPVLGLPGGNDLALTAVGAADIPFTNQKTATTTTASIGVGVNTNVLVGSTVGFGTGAGAGLTIGRATVNEETIATGNWSIVDGTHFTFTAANTHTGTTDIEQIGTFVFDGRAMVFNGAQAPAQNPSAPYPFFDLNLSPILFMPRNTEQGGALEQNVMLGANVGLVFLSANTLPPIVGSVSKVGIDASGNLNLSPATGKTVLAESLAIQEATVTASGSTDALTFPGSTFVTTAGVDAMTLATPVATTDDGKKLTVTDTSGHAHTITTAASKIAPGHHLITFNGTVGSFVTLQAFQGLWYVQASSGVTVS